MTDNPTAIYPDVDRLWNTHKSLPFECDDQDCMTIDGFKAALNEAELRERWEYWSAKYEALRREFHEYRKLAQENESIGHQALDDLQRAKLALADAQAEGRRQGLEEARLAYGSHYAVTPGGAENCVDCGENWRSSIHLSAAEDRNGRIRALLDSQNASPAPQEEK